MRDAENTSDAGRPNSVSTLARVRIAQSMAFLANRLPAPPARVLDVGCGSGELAVAMGERGYEVTAIDSDPHVVQLAGRRGLAVIAADIADYDDRPFDALLFSLSLHHIEHLDQALTRARALLNAGGVLIADEFAWERADRATAAWFYDTADELSDAGLLPSYQRPGVIEDPLRRWVARHRDEDPMHTGEAMIRIVGAEFELRETVRTPYLHRYLGGWFVDDTAGTQALASLRNIERSKIAGGSLAAVGLQLLARRPD